MPPALPIGERVQACRVRGSTDERPVLETLEEQGDDDPVIGELISTAGASLFPRQRTSKLQWGAILSVRADRLVASLSAAALLVPASLAAQAVPFHTQTLITPGFGEGAAHIFSTFAGRRGLLSDGAEIPDLMDRDIDVFVQRELVRPFAFSAMWTTRIVLPYVRKSMEFTPIGGTRQRFSTAGIGDVIVDTKWIFLSKNRPGGTTRLGVQGGVKIPLGSTDATLPDGMVAPRPLQAGSGSWDFPFKALFMMTRGRFGLLANTGYRINTSDEGIDAGNVFSYDVALGLRLAPWGDKSFKDRSLTVYLELNGKAASQDEIAGTPNPDSGGHLLFLSPDIQLRPTRWLMFEGSVQFPIVQDLNGIQLGYDPRFQLGTRFRFSFFR
jgi:Putative MetA-pathway of phenol degradation